MPESMTGGKGKKKRTKRTKKRVARKTTGGASHVPAALKKAAVKKGIRLTVGKNTRRPKSAATLRKQLAHKK